MSQKPDCEPYNNKFEYQLNYLCFNHFDNTFQTTVLLVITLLMIGVNVYIILESKKVKRKLLTPNNSQNQTYCVFHLRIIQFVQVYSVLTLIHLLGYLLQLGTYGNFKSIVLDGPSCDEKLNKLTAPIQIFFYVDDILAPVITYFVFGVLLLQCQEWCAMIYMILT